MLFVGKIDQLLRLRRGAGEWFFHKDVLAILQRGLGKFEMSPHRRNYRDSVNVCRGDYLGCVGRNLNSSISSLYALPCSGALVSNSLNAGPFHAVEVPDYVWAPVAVADHAKSHHIFAAL